MLTKRHRLTLHNAVQRGAALLDAKAPGWEAKIRPPELMMRVTDQCILGHAFGDYFVGLKMLALDRRSALTTTRVATRHGFDVALGQAHDEEYSALAEEWLALLAERRPEAQSRADAARGA